MKDEHQGIIQILGHLFETATEKITAAIASAAMLMPVWNPSLKDTSEFAALIAPIIGVAWLLLQIGVKLWELTHRRK